VVLLVVKLDALGCGSEDGAKSCGGVCWVGGGGRLETGNEPANVEEAFVPFGM
jgi:hypothetical protein